jgi:GNAT superfamily N-acetyltransferase
MTTRLRDASPDDLAACIRLRGATRDNAIAADALAAVGVTELAWSARLRDGSLIGCVATSGEAAIGFCFADVTCGEVMVLAIAASHDGHGLGRALLDRITARLATHGLARAFLGCATDPRLRSHGFYRHLGWQPTGMLDGNGDEVLSKQLP